MTMQTIPVPLNATSRSYDISLVQNAASTAAGDPILGLAYNTSGIQAYSSVGSSGALTAITLATQTPTGAYSSGGFVQKSSTQAPGQYRFDPPNSLFTAVGIVAVTFSGTPAGTAGNMETHTVYFAVGDVASILTTQLTESYAASTVVPDVRQALLMILQTLLGFNGSGSTLTVYKRDNATTAIAGTFNSSSNATGLTQTT